MSYGSALKKLLRAIEKVRGPAKRRRPAKRRATPKPPRTDAPVEQLVERVRSELPEVFGPPSPPATVLELYGPWDFGTPTGRVVAEVKQSRAVDRMAWATTDGSDAA